MTSTPTESSRLSGAAGRRRRSRSFPEQLSNGVLVAGAAIIIVLVLITASVEHSLPAVRLPHLRANTVSESLTPGYHPILNSAATTTGIWFQQPLGNRVSIASNQAGASLSFHFDGTEVQLDARIGPESGEVYVSVDGAPVPHLLQDAKGRSYLDLSAAQAEADQILVVSNLSHEQHTMTLTNADGSELAVYGVTVKSQTPFPWAFGLLYGFLGILLFLILRLLAMRYAASRGWLIPPAESSSRQALR